MKRRRRRNIKRILYLIYVICIVEALARIVFYCYFIKLGKSGHQGEIGKIEYVYRLINRRSEQGVEFPFHCWAYDENRGYKLAPNVNGYNIYNSTVSSNSKGVRGKKEYTYERKKEFKRIVAIGDSFTFGEEVNDNQTWPAVLETLLKNTEVINLGCSAYAHDQIFFSLRDEGVKYAPDIILLGYFKSDVPRNMENFLCYAKPQVIEKDGKYFFSNIPVPTPKELIKEVMYQSQLYLISKFLFNKTFKDHGSAQAITVYILNQIKETASKINARLIFVFLPTHHEMRRASFGFIRNYCEENNIEYIETTDIFEKEIAKLGDEQFKRRYFQFASEHYSPKGNAMVAGIIEEHLLRCAK